MITYQLTLFIAGETCPMRIDADTHDTDGPDTVFYGPHLVEICRVRTETILKIEEATRPTENTENTEGNA